MVPPWPVLPHNQQPAELCSNIAGSCKLALLGLRAPHPFPYVPPLPPLIPHSRPQFKRAYQRNDKPVCLAAIKFIAHLANQQVVHEVLPLEVLLLLLETPSDDGVEVAVDFLKEVGNRVAGF